MTTKNNPSPSSIPSLLARTLAAALAAAACGCGGPDEPPVAAPGTSASSKPLETVEDFSSAARRAFADSKGPEALALVRKARALKPESAELALFEGEALFLSGEEKAAIERFVSIAEDTKLASALRSQAYCDIAAAHLEHFLAGRTGEGEERVDLEIWAYLARAVALDPSNPRAWYHLGRSAEVSHFDQAALGLFARAKSSAAHERFPLDAPHAAGASKALDAAKASLGKIDKSAREKSRALLAEANNLLSQAAAVRPKANTQRARREAKANADTLRANARKKLDEAIAADSLNAGAIWRYIEEFGPSSKTEDVLQRYSAALKASPGIDRCIAAAEYALSKNQPLQAERFMYIALAHLYFDNSADVRRVSSLYAKVLKKLGRPEAAIMEKLSKS